MRVFPAVITVLLAFVASTLALRDYFTRDDLLSIARAYKRSSDLVDMLLPRDKGSVFCINKGQNKHFKDYPFVTQADTLHKAANTLMTEWNALRKEKKNKEATAKEKEYKAALKKYEAAAAGLKKFEKNGCTAGGKVNFASSHNCGGHAYFCETAQGGMTCTSLSKKTPQFEGGECFV
ncbi:uncharacterized protein C8Q71DRAFT_854962 [Rhodofomes roseus]|uniref:Uncharacterized protein n=1 Tax=Rhodofomes roseus TaxID=34475 RepID=A0A4Y9YK44_9APHY|nr:uncharacterized protein C8Q71DRAFT_854962 [Rhodofomes roseus]KAH9841113.1 hypothetical protein C8Q71DRAFT_854962 [Rhodofomes roseus]TFY62340.1 hypothetical protein EVJ58_g3929 [Rhodofomes roseus]